MTPPDPLKPARAATLSPTPWSRPAPTTTARRRRAGAILAGVALLLLTLWVVPPLLDWGRFRGTIAAIAAARLGRPVRIDGEVTLRLLPGAVLNAADVTLPDQGDGVSATIASLRLEVALVPLLDGRLAPRDLVLGTPVLRLPWPLPETLVPGRPRVPRAFAAHLDHGTLLIGGARIDGINAALRSGPDRWTGGGANPAEPGVQGFGAEGFAAFAGRRWRFTTALGAPDADGVSAIDLSVGGQGAAAHTDATVRGTLADGVLQGRLVAGGPDLSLLLPAAALAWHAEAPFVADGAQIAAPSLGLSLGVSSGDGALTLHLARPVRLEGRLHAASIDLDGWAGALPARLAAGRATRPGLSGRLELSADRATLLGGVLGAVHGTLASTGSGLTLQDGEAMLPGAARLTLSGDIDIAGAAGGVRVHGPATLDAPSLRATLAWLRPLAPALADALPAGVLTRAKLSGTAGFGPSGISVSGLSGEIDGGAVTGGFGARLGPHPHLGLGLAVERVDLEPWLGTLWPARSPGLAGLGRAATGLATDIHLRARAAAWRGRVVEKLALDAQTGPGGLAVQHAGFELDGAQIEASGGVAPDGAVSGGVVRIAAPGPAGLSPWLPPEWGWAQPLWQGAAALHATLSGPAHDLSVEVRADAGDLVLEADGRADPEGARAVGSLTLRHPGAPRLLATLGEAGAESWLGTGSLAVRAQVEAAPDGVTIGDFDLRAAELGVSGHLAYNRAVAEPSWTGTLVASVLPLPDTGRIGALLQRWHDYPSAVIGLTAADVRIGGRNAVEDVVAKISLAHGAGLIDVVHAAVVGGQASGEVAFDDGGGRTAIAARGSLTEAAMAFAPSLPIHVAAGRADISADVSGEGALAWSGRLSGQLGATARQATLAGFDLARAGAALSQHGHAARIALTAALSQGETAGLSGTLAATLTDGRAGLTGARLTSEDGIVDVRGSADVSTRSLDLVFALAPNGVMTPSLGVRMTGPWAAPQTLPLGTPPPRRRTPKG